MATNPNSLGRRLVVSLTDRLISHEAVLTADFRDNTLLQGLVERRITLTPGFNPEEMHGRIRGSIPQRIITEKEMKAIAAEEYEAELMASDWEPYI